MELPDEVPGDASTLIYLAKADAFEAAASCVPTILVSPGVWRESVEAGEELGYPDVPRIRTAEATGSVRRVELSTIEAAAAGTIASHHRLGLGESEVLALARTGRRALVDEGRAARAARALGIVPISTLFLPVLGRRRGELGASGAIELLRRLAIVTGARAEVVFAIEEALRKDAQ
jgi:predicted nucleic acid-binding protein